MAYFYTVSLQTDFNNNNVWVPVDPTVSSIKITKDSSAKWVIRVYKDVEDTTHQLNYNNGSASIDSTQVTVSGSSSVISWTYSGGHVKLIGIDYPGVGRRDKFEIQVKPNTIPGTFKPSISVVRFADNGLNNGGTVAIAVPIKTGQSIQTISYTTSTDVVPSFPKTYTDEGPTFGNTTDLYNATVGAGGAKAPNLKWDPSVAPDGAWIYVTQVAVSGGYQVTTWTFDRKGHKLSKVSGKDTSKNGPLWKAAQALLLKAVQDQSTVSGSTDVGTPSVPDTTNSNQFFNPPTHIWTRRPSLDQLMLANIATDPAAISNFLNTSAQHPLGFAVQDLNIAKNLNKKLKNTKKTKVYGFNFHYNPTSISYTTSANTPIDWTLSSSDPANIIGGPFILTFDLYLNRIQDLQELKTKYNASSYPGRNGLNTEDIEGILTRGTEYDLEFLYRVVNGEPAKTLLLDPASKGVTSDFGYITGSPFFLQLHKNMKYYGGLAGINVNHVMFTKDMIPILTVVSLTFNRYPIFDSTIVGSSGKVSSAKDALKSSLSTPSSGGTN